MCIIEGCYWYLLISANFRHFKYLYSIWWKHQVNRCCKFTIIKSFLFKNKISFLITKIPVLNIFIMYIWFKKCYEKALFLKKDYCLHISNHRNMYYEQKFKKKNKF